ncbi:hypothetical protein NOC27_151 [Nitrosococcus oceani AFC27]|nr:hypothetical protein NOC27_151 [Nitrosococcus oceani AFC27]
MVGQSQPHAYRFHSTQMQVTYLEGKLVADRPEDWKFRSFAKEVVAKDGQLYTKIVFQPQKARTSRATLVFKLKSKILGSNTVTVKIPLIGKGIAPAPKPILPGDKIIPTPKLDEGPDKTKPRDTSVKKICLDFILVDNRDTKTWNKKAQEWTEKSNEIFKKVKSKSCFQSLNRSAGLQRTTSKRRLIKLLLDNCIVSRFLS